MKHIIITRYNISKVDSNLVSKGLDPEWLEYRLWLWTNYLVPSLKAQTNQSFEYVLHMNPKTPQDYLDKLKAAYPKVIFSFTKNPIEYIGDYDWELITTRVDSDDCLSKYYVEDIQKARINHDKQLLIPSKWVDLQRVTNTFVYCDVPIKRWHIYSNPFISFYEKQAPYDTVVKYTHHTMWIEYPHIIVDKRPLWMRIMHWGNVSNNHVLDNKTLTKELLEWYDYLPNINDIYDAMTSYNNRTQR